MADDLREQLIVRLESEPLFGTGEIVDAVLAALAADPGNLPARMAEVIGSHEWTDFPRSAHNQHNYYAECAVCQRDVPRIAEVALGVRDGLVAHLSARAAEAEARVEHAEAGAELSSELLAEARQELAEAREMFKLMCQQVGVFEGQLDLMTQMRDSEKKRADDLVAERDTLRARLTGVAIHANRLQTRIAPGSDAWAVLGDLRTALTAPAEGTTTPAWETA